MEFCNVIYCVYKGRYFYSYHNLRVGPKNKILKRLSKQMSCSNFDFLHICSVSSKIQEATGEKLSTFYLFQIISMAIQKGNAACVQGCVKDTSPGLEGLFNFQVHEAEEL